MASVCLCWSGNWIKKWMKRWINWRTTLPSHPDIKTRAISRVWVQIPSPLLLSYQGAPEQHKQEVPGRRATLMLRHVSFMFVHAYLSLSLTFTHNYTCSFYSPWITRWWRFTEEWLGSDFHDACFFFFFLFFNSLVMQIWIYYLI